MLIRKVIDTAVESYVVDHYPQGVFSTYSDQQLIKVIIVCNKYNPNNYWYRKRSASGMTIG